MTWHELILLNLSPTASAIRFPKFYRKRGLSKPSTLEEKKINSVHLHSPQSAVNENRLRGLPGSGLPCDVAPLRVFLWETRMGWRLRKQLMKDGFAVVLTCDGIFIVSIERPLEPAEMQPPSPAHLPEIEFR